MDFILNLFLLPWWGFKYILSAVIWYLVIVWLYDRYNANGNESHHWFKWGIGYKNEIIKDKLIKVQPFLN